MPLVRPVTNTSAPLTLNIGFDSFLVSSLENHIAEELNLQLFNYFFLKEACCLVTDKNLVDAKTFCGMTFSSITHSQPSNIVYLPIVDMHADTREAMEVVLSKLHSEYGIGVTSQHLVVAGDQKTYTRLQELKHAYGSDLNWLVPFIGDWHLLHNFHSVLMKVYYDAGLRDLAVSSGFRGETLTSLKRCSNFKRTHAFLLQSFEAFYRHFLATYLSSHEDKDLYNDFLSSTSAHLCECNKECHDKNSTTPLQAFLKQMNSLHPNFFGDFRSWLLDLQNKDPIWKFWINFVFRDAFSYFSLFFAIRGGIWNLRLYGIKQIAPLFAAFDRLHYHLHEVLTMPQEVINHFKNGSFVCSVTGKSVHSVGLDEAHEMLVNKDLKTTVVRPTKEYVDRIIHYYRVRSQALKALKQQVFLDRSTKSSSTSSFFDATKLLEVGTPNHLQSLSFQLATPEQEKDLLSFWEVGLSHFENKVKYFILRDPSADVPQRQAKLLTYTISKTGKKKIKMIERERKIVSKCVRRSLAWNARVDCDHQQSGGQLSAIKARFQ